MAITLKARAGLSLKFHVRNWEDEEKLMLANSTGYTARLQVRSTQTPSRVLLDTAEVALTAPTDPIPPGTVLTRIEPGHWLVFFGKTRVNRFPSTLRFELELTSNTDPDDVIPLCVGSIQVEPQGVISVD